jgi:5-methyltetrahydrofolate--homocysteine methyltransferase
VANAWFLGAQGRFFPESHSIAFTPPQPGQPIEGLAFRYDSGNVYLQRALNLMRCALARWGSQVSVGIYDLFSNLDLIDVFRGTQQLALDMVDTPGEVLRLMREAIEVNRRFYAEAQAVRAGIARGCSTWGPLWAPRSYTMVQSDYSYMISPRMFERFVLPDVTAWCEQTEYTCYHLDGPGQLAHLDMLLALPHLNAIQWQPGVGEPTAGAWPEVLRKIRAAGKLCQVYVPLSDALRITRELGGRGFVFTVLDYVSSDEARDFAAVMAAEVRAG